MHGSRSSAGFYDSPTLDGQHYSLDNPQYQPVAISPPQGSMPPQHALDSGFSGIAVAQHYNSNNNYNGNNYNYSHPIPADGAPFNPYADYVVPPAAAAAAGAYFPARTSSPPPPPGAQYPSSHYPPSPPPPPQSHSPNSSQYAHAHSPSLEPLLADYYRREGASQTPGNASSSGNVVNSNHNSHHDNDNVGRGVGGEPSGTISSALSNPPQPPPAVPPRSPLRAFGLGGGAVGLGVGLGVDKDKDRDGDKDGDQRISSSVYSSEGVGVVRDDVDDASFLRDRDIQDVNDDYGDYREGDDPKPVLGVRNPDLVGSARPSLDS
ncbi:hypothetical protein ONZ45_g856 [Pleurotus djamor]|nr:hypothetical protein ONZ45_g856 [Pleurotus djamor]